MNGSAQVAQERAVVQPAAEMSVIRKLRCNRCPYRTVQKSNLQRHREGHLRTRPESMRYKCPYCDFYQETRRRIQRHMCLHPQHVKRGTQGVLETNGNDERATYLTRIVPDTAAQLCETEVQVIQAKGDIRLVNTENNGSLFTCDICPFVTNLNSQFIYHKQFHR